MQCNIIISKRVCFFEQDPGLNSNNQVPLAPSARFAGLCLQSVTVTVRLNSVEVLADTERFPGWAPASVQWKRGSEGRGGGSQMSTQSLNTLEYMRGWLVKFTHLQTDTNTHTTSLTKSPLNTKIWKHATTHKQVQDLHFDRKMERFVLSQGLNGNGDGSKCLCSSHRPWGNTSAVLETSTRHQMGRK